MPLSLPAAAAEERIEKLLIHWSQVEESIKSAELIEHKVTIPAINELRYAGRQLLWAIIEFRKGRDNEPDRLEKAIVNAEQYLINADHDVVDAVTLFFGRRIDELNFRYGRAAIAAKYPAYDELCEIKVSCYRLIEESRRDSTKRRSIYAEIKRSYLPNLIALHTALVETDVIMTTETSRYLYKINALTKQLKFYKIVSFTSAGLSIAYIAFRLCIWLIY